MLVLFLWLLFLPLLSWLLKLPSILRRHVYQCCVDAVVHTVYNSSVPIYGHFTFSELSSQKTHPIDYHMTSYHNIHEILQWLFKRIFLCAKSNQAFNSSGCCHLVLLCSIIRLMVNCFFCLNVWAYHIEDTPGNHENHARYITVSGFPVTTLALFTKRQRDTSITSNLSPSPKDVGK